MSSASSRQIQVSQQQREAPTPRCAADSGVGGAVRSARMAAIAGNNTDGFSKQRPQQRKGRSKKKRGGGGGGICAVDGSSAAVTAAAAAAAASSTDGPPKQKKKRRHQKKQARKERQHPDHRDDVQHGEKLPARDPEQQQDRVMRASTAPVSRETVLPFERENAAAAGKDAKIGDGTPKAAGAAEDVAPFECSWTTAPGGGGYENNPMGRPKAEFLAEAKPEEGSESSGSSGSFQSFQIGEEDSPYEAQAIDDADENKTSRNIVSVRPAAVHEEAQANDPRSGHDGENSSAKRIERRDDDDELEVLASDSKTQRSCPEDEGWEEDRGITREGHDGVHDEKFGQEDETPVAPTTPSLPHELPAARQQHVRFAMDGRNERNVGGDGGVGDGGKGNGEDEHHEDGEGQADETALLLSSNDRTVAESRKAEAASQSRTQERLGTGEHSDAKCVEAVTSSNVQRPQHPQPTEVLRRRTTSNAVVEDDEFMVDDIDDESSTLLNPSRVDSASTAATAGAPRPESMPDSTAVAASTPALSPTVESSPVATETVAGAPASAAAGGVSTSGVIPAAPAAAFNYYELPPASNDALACGNKLQQRTGSGHPPATVTWCAEAPNPSSPSRPRLPGENPNTNNDALQVSPCGIWAAVRRGDAAGVRAKLAAGATIDDADTKGRTPLMVACASGDARMATLLVNGVSPPASVAARTIEGWTPLMIASGGGRLGVVKVLLHAGASLHDRDDEFGSNSFMWACGGGHSDVVRLMLQQSGSKALLLSTNSDMWTATMVACDAGSLDTVRVLVEAGGDLGAFNSEGLTALDIAADRNHLLLVCYLRTEQAFSSTQFWAAADSGNAVVMSNLLRSNGHLVAALDKDGRTALLRSCIGGHLEVARILVEAGADVDFQDSSGTSSLSVAVVLGDKALTRYLVQAGGARLAVKNDAGWTPLMQAVAKGDLVMTRYLVDRGAAVNDGVPGGESVLDMARRFSSPELQRYLAAKGGFSSHEVQRQIGEVNDGGRGLFRFW
ncbi:unnamed protein product [Scytosiphon promiscuus]